LNKYLITGISGFVAYHMLEYLNTLNIKINVLGIDLNIPKHVKEYSFENINLSFLKINLLEYKSLEIAVISFNPNFIVHLASFSSVGKSWEKPMECFLNNTNIFLNIAEIVRHNKIKCRILSVGSSEEYGKINKNDLPLKEYTNLNPDNPYAVARVSQEMLSQFYVKAFKLDIILTRSFNHIGTGQRLDFAIPSFIKQISDGLKKGLKSITLLTGDIAIIRDFIDVRDVVRAYYYLLEKGNTGELYNICSGKGYSLKEIIEILAILYKIDIITIIDKDKIRPVDNNIIIGCFDKLKLQTGWEPKYNIDESLTEIKNNLNVKE